MKKLNLTFEQKYLLKQVDKTSIFPVETIHLYSLFFPNRIEKRIREIEELYEELDVLHEQIKADQNYVPTKELVDLKNSASIITDNFVSLVKSLNLLEFPSNFVEFAFALTILKSKLDTVYTLSYDKTFVKS